MSERSERINVTAGPAQRAAPEGGAMSELSERINVTVSPAQRAAPEGGAR
jgi:hypothetical protein